ncbi:hypothetical protein GQ457_12G032030 [Hibiscus cannabinus]
MSQSSLSANEDGVNCRVKPPTVAIYSSFAVRNTGFVPGRGPRLKDYMLPEGRGRAWTQGFVLVLGISGKPESELGMEESDETPRTHATKGISVYILFRHHIYVKGSEAKLTYMNKF